jgi:hypothetical protein
MKICSKCSVTKVLSEFHKDSSKRDGLRPDCKECVRTKSLEYAHSDTGKVKRSEYNKQWSVINSHKKNASTVQRNATKLRATVSWANIDVIEGLYKQARELTIRTGNPHQVDHIVPLRSEIVCGLHVEHNLRVITGLDNRIKGNRLWPDYP